MAVAAASEGFVGLLEAPEVPAEQKQAAMRRVFPDATERGYTLLTILARRRALRLLPRIRDEFEVAADALEGFQRVQVRTAVPIDSGVQQRIVQQFTAFLGREARVAAQVDPALLGGMVVRIGDRVMDGSARGRLQALRQSLTTGQT
jgi:F-type H+-transporting ATPase subunit delta